MSGINNCDGVTWLSDGEGLPHRLTRDRGFQLLDRPPFPHLPVRFSRAHSLRSRLRRDCDFPLESEPHVFTSLAHAFIIADGNSKNADKHTNAGNTDTNKTTHQKIIYTGKYTLTQVYLRYIIRSKYKTNIQTYLYVKLRHAYIVTPAWIHAHGH